jgi:hypothetical protein
MVECDTHPNHRQQRVIRTQPITNKFREENATAGSASSLGDGRGDSLCIVSATSHGQHGASVLDFYGQRRDEIVVGSPGSEARVGSATRSIGVGDPTHWLCDFAFNEFGRAEGP